LFSEKIIIFIGSLTVLESGNLTLGTNGTISADVAGPWFMNGNNTQNKKQKTKKKLK
jgi:hypothetical protein